MAKGKLSIVATPIGNLSDWSYRAVETCKMADIIACEDTRVSRKLLSHYAISTKYMSYHDHNAARQVGVIIEMLEDGKHIALISDAGTPLISDPGYRLVKEARKADCHIEAIAGASSVTAALSIAGLPTDRFLFLGFLPSKTVARKKELSKFADIDATLVVFESAKRLAKSLSDMVECLGEGREVAIVREITKRYEEVLSGTLGELLERITEAPVKGEIVMVIAPDKGGDSKSQEEIDANIITILQENMESMKLKDAVKATVEKTGQSRNKVYAMALKIKEN